MALALAAAAAGCAELKELPEIGSLIYQGDDFEVWASDGLTACGGTHAYTEAWLASFRARLGDEATPRYHRFYWVGPDDVDEVPCSHGEACAFTSRAFKRIYSPWIPIEHEIVHVELAHLVGVPLMTEGAAEMFGSPAAANTAEIASIEGFLDGSPLPSSAYASAGRFARFLYDSAGQTAYFDLLRAAEPVNDRKGLEAAFADALGISIDEAIADYEEFSPCAPPRWRFHDYECSDLATTPWQAPERWQETIALDCANEDVIGPRDEVFGPGEAEVWTLRALDVAELGPYRLSVTSDEPATVDLQPCFDFCFDGDGVAVSTFATVEHASPVSVLAPGRYWMRVAHAADSAADVTVALERADVH